MVDDEVGWDKWVDLRRVATEGLHRVAHCREVDHARDTGEVLEDDTRRHERHLEVAARAGCPGGEGADILFGDELGARISQHVLKEHADREREARRIVDECAQAVDSVRTAGDIKGVAGAERVADAAHRRLQSQRVSWPARLPQPRVSIQNAACPR